MAYYSTRESREHAYKVFQKTLKSPEFPSLVLLCGRENYLAKWALNEIRRRFLSDASASLDENLFYGEGGSTADIIEACETLPIMSERRIVVVEDSVFLKSGAAGGEGASKSKFEEKELCEYIKVLPDSVVLVFIVDGNADAKSILYKQIKKSGIIYDFGLLDRSTLLGFAKKQLLLYEKTASIQALYTFLDLTGYGSKGSEYDLYSLMNDINKASMLAAGDIVEEEDFKAVVAIDMQADVFRLLDAAFRGDRGQALELLSANFSVSGYEERSNAVFGFISLLCSQLEIMFTAREMLADGFSVPQIRDFMQINEYRLKKAIEASNPIDTVTLARTFLAACQLDRVIKEGLMPGDLTLEMFIASL